MALNQAQVPLKLYRTEITQDTLGAHVVSLVVVYEWVWGVRKELVGQELFRARQLQYDDPRNYIMLDDPEIQQGRILEESDGSRYVIVSRQRVGEHRIQVMAVRGQGSTIIPHAIGSLSTYTLTAVGASLALQATAPKVIGYMRWQWPFGIKFNRFSAIVAASGLSAVASAGIYDAVTRQKIALIQRMPATAGFVGLAQSVTVPMTVLQPNKPVFLAFSYTVSTVRLRGIANAANAGFISLLGTGGIGEITTQEFEELPDELPPGESDFVSTSPLAVLLDIV